MLVLAFYVTCNSIALFTDSFIYILKQKSWIHDFPSFFFQIHFNIIRPFMIKSPKWSLAFPFLRQNFVFLLADGLIIDLCSGPDKLIPQFNHIALKFIQ